MLNDFYFLGLGNDIEGYPILSGQNLEVCYMFPSKYGIYSNNLTISVNQMIDPQYYLEDKDVVVISGEQEVSGHFEEISAFTSSLIVDVNAMFNSYEKNNDLEIFAINDIFCTKSDLNLYKTTNRLLKNEYSNIDYFNRRGNKRSFVGAENIRLMVTEDLIDLELCNSLSENLYEFVDQFNKTLSGAIMSGLNSWRTKRIHYPVSNYGNSLTTSSYIYDFDSKSCLYFGLSSAVVENYNASPIYHDIYYANNNAIFAPATSGSNIYENELSGFTFKEKAYVLSGTAINAYLYKHIDNYFPITYTNSRISEFAPIAIKDLGQMEIISGQWIKKTQSYFYNNHKTYIIGEWENGLHYTSGFTTNIECYDFSLTELPITAGFNYYPYMIGVNKLYQGINPINMNTKLITKIHYKNTEQLYVAIDPQSYSIAL